MIKSVIYANAKHSIKNNANEAKNVFKIKILFKWKSLL